MIGLSTSYYAMKGLSIYDSVIKTVELGFEHIELGAAHEFEDNALSTLRKIKKDFPSVSFTVHTLFPPLRKRVWFNPADGLNKINKEIIDGLFEAASIVDASLISIHPPVLNEINLMDVNLSNFHKLEIGQPKSLKESKGNFFQLMEYISRKTEAKKTKIIIENVGAVNSQLIESYPYAKEDYFEIFEKFPDAGMLLDVGHALQAGNLNELVEMDGKVFELHLHDIGYESDNKLNAHFPIKSSEFFDPLTEIVKKDSMVSVFEHGTNVTEEEILKEKELLEIFIANHTRLCA
jgi:sugar phosphate isomerase/epimerase